MLKKIARKIFGDHIDRGRNGKYRDYPRDRLSNSLLILLRFFKINYILGWRKKVKLEKEKILYIPDLILFHRVILFMVISSV